MKSRFIACFFVPLSLLLFLITSCKKESNPATPTPSPSNKELPTVFTDRIDGISQKMATVVSTVTKDGNSSLTDKGIVFSKNPNPTVLTAINMPNSGNGLGTFNTNLSNLEMGTIYYVRTYATNSVGTAYSEQKTFTTLSSAAPTLYSNSITDILQESAKGGGNITSQGSSPVTERGLVWSTSPAPTLSSPGKAIATSIGLGPYTLAITGLTSGAKYYVRAFATNGELTGYGNEESFMTSSSIFILGNGLTDIDGNTYNTVIINGQEWMKENLKVSKYRNGTLIPTGLTDNQWASTATGAYAIYNNDEANNATYGKLYNWYTTIDPNGLCPAGWHVPSDTEWTSLEDFLGGSTVSGGKLKAINIWQAPNIGATNESGFTSLPSGGRSNSDGVYLGIGANGGFWTSTTTATNGGWNRYLGYTYSNTYRLSGTKNSGMSVRCLKD